METESHLFDRPRRINGRHVIDIPLKDNFFSLFNLKAVDPSYSFIEVQAEGFILETR